MAQEHSSKVTTWGNAPINGEAGFIVIAGGWQGTWGRAGSLVEAEKAKVRGIAALRSTRIYVASPDSGAYVNEFDGSLVWPQGTVIRPQSERALPDKIAHARQVRACARIFDH